MQILLQTKGGFIPENHTDYIFVTTGSRLEVSRWFYVYLLILLIGVFIYFKNKRKKS
ncbi:hypothetical protein [Flavobacterium sp.]|uniref:hypothetical protein n=1 Tax=Flavobacterium sp. TaxID=239 RepID=UPI003753AC46